MWGLLHANLWHIYAIYHQFGFHHEARLQVETCHILVNPFIRVHYFLHSGILFVLSVVKSKSYLSSTHLIRRCESSSFGKHGSLTDYLATLENWKPSWWISLPQSTLVKIHVHLYLLVYSFLIEWVIFYFCL